MSEELDSPDEMDTELNESGCAPDIINTTPSEGKNNNQPSCLVYNLLISAHQIKMKLKTIRLVGFSYVYRRKQNNKF